MNTSTSTPFFEVFDAVTYNMKEPTIHESMESEQLKDRFEQPRRPKSIERIYDSVLDKFKQKFLPLDIYKVSDNDGSVMICEEFKYTSEDEVRQLSTLLRTVRKHENLLDFKEIHIFRKERKFWVLSTDTNLEFVKKKLNKETKCPFSLYTIMKFYRDIESAVEHLAKVKDNQISLFKDVMLPIISTTGILFSHEDITFKIGLSMAYAAYWEQHEVKYAHLDIQNALRNQNACELSRSHKEMYIIFSLGLVFLEVTTGYFSELVLDKIKISEGPYSKDAIEASKLRDVLFDVRKEQMFAMNTEQLKYMDKYHFPYVLGMVSKPEWTQIIGQKYFARRLWSYRYDPTKLPLDPEPDWPFNSFLHKQDLNSNLLVDGINSTIFLHFFYLTGEALTGDKYRKLIKDEDKVSSFLNDIKEKLNLKLTEPPSQESTNYSLEKCLDVDPQSQEPRKMLKSEIIAIFKKNCIVHKCWLDILTLSVEFGDDLNHLSSVIATTFPYMSTEIDENRRIVFRIANTMSPGDRVVDIMLDTLDIMIITVNCIRLKFDECIKGERFGRLSKSASFVVEEIIEKIKEYKDVKQEIILRHSKSQFTNN